VAAIFAVWLQSYGLAGAEEAPLRHELSFAGRLNQYVQVTSVWPAGTEYLELSMPSWTPGSYLIRDFAGHVEGLRALDEKGQQRSVRKTAKNSWRIEAAGTERLTVSYAVWAGEINVATSWVEADFALLNGAGIFMYNEASRQKPQEVAIELPAAWPDVDVPLPAAGQQRTWRARNYDELIDSPIVAGTLDRREFKVRGQSYELLTAAGNALWDIDQSADDVAKIVGAHQEFWNTNPFERPYLFFNFFLGGFGGLEHDHSTVMMCSPWQMTERADYIKWLGLVSHEFFHAWNVRRMRPAALAVYDYDQEMYTRELWLAEGFSSYYDSLLLFRGGLISVAEYFDLLAQEIRNYESMPGRHVRSAEHASFDAWINQYQPDENSVNSTVSYYRKGALIGFVADTAIRRRTDHRASLDTIMRDMYQRYGPTGPDRGAYPSGAFEDEVERVAGREVRELVEDLLKTTNDPDVDAALDWYGLRLDRVPAQAGQNVTGVAEPVDFGVEWQVSGERLLAMHVLLGQTGARAGILPGDELLAIDGLRVTTLNYVERIRRLRPGQSVELTLVRHERLLQLVAEAQRAMADRYVIAAQDKLRRAEQRNLERWLGRELHFER